MRVVPVLVRLGGQTVELGQAVLGDEAQQAWLELEPADVRRVLQRIDASVGGRAPSRGRHDDAGALVDPGRNPPERARSTEPEGLAVEARPRGKGGEGAALGSSQADEPGVEHGRSTRSEELRRPESSPTPTAARLTSRAKDTTERCVADLEWLAERSQRILADPKKERWHAALRAQLASILEELNRLQSRTH